MDHIRFASFRFRFRTLADLELPPVNKGNTLRGAFGFALKHLVCTMPSRCHPRCEHPQTCPYGQIFETSPPEGSQRLSANSDIPRPFVFRPPLTTRQLFPRGTDIEFGLVIFGRMIEKFPYFAMALKTISEEGIGTKKAPLDLISVSGQLPGRDVALYGAAEKEFRNEPVVFTISDLSSAHARRSRTRITLEFLSPTVLKSEGKIVEEPAFHHLLKRLRDRINSIGFFYCGRPLEVDFRTMGESAERVRTVASNLHWANQSRRSWKTGKRHPMGGFVGKITFEGDLEPFLPLLLVGQYTHVGKFAVWGNGRYQICG